MADSKCIEYNLSNSYTLKTPRVSWGTLTQHCMWSFVRLRNSLKAPCHANRRSITQQHFFKFAILFCKQNCNYNIISTLLPWVLRNFFLPKKFNVTNPDWRFYVEEVTGKTRLRLVEVNKREPVWAKFEESQIPNSSTPSNS